MGNEGPELGYEEFARARKLYWQARNNYYECVGGPPEASATTLAQGGSNFVLYSAGPRRIFAVFENFAQSGWFYLYDAVQQKIAKSACIYNRANVAIEEDVIDIGWATDDSACGLAVRGEFRAFLGVSNDVHLERPVTRAAEDGIPLTRWPAGFELYLEKKFD